MDKFTLEELSKIKKIEPFVNFIRPFYPGLEISKYTIKNIEKALFDTYIKLIGKIIMYSPENMRVFLRNFLLKFEIMNLKQIIIGSIVGLTREQKEKNINFTVEEFLDNEEFFTDLLNISSLDEIQLYLRGTKYNKVVREGLLYFNNTNEIFVLESFLDQLYYENLNSHVKFFNKKEKEMISLFISYKTEIYNLNMIYRGIKNSIDRKLLKQFLVSNHLFLNDSKLDILLNLEKVNEFIEQLNAYFKRVEDIKGIFNPLDPETTHLKEKIEESYQDYYFRQFEIKIDDIEYTTIYRILEIVIKKEKEIWYDVIPQMVEIIHQKFEMLKSYL